MYLYLIINKQSKFVYVGKTRNESRKRQYEHFAKLERGVHRNPKLQEDYDSIGRGGFEFRVILKCESDEHLARTEESYIRGLEARGVILYNIWHTSSGYRPSADTLAKLRAYKPTPEALARQSAAQTGQKRSETTKAKIAAAAKASWQNPNRGDFAKNPEFRAKAKAAADLGWETRDRTVSDETRAKIGEGAREVWSDPEYRVTMSAKQQARWTPEERAKASVRETGKQLSDETKEKIRQAMLEHRALEREALGLPEPVRSPQGETDEERQSRKQSNIGAVSKRNWSDPEFRARTSAAHVGKGHTQETKDKIRATMLAKREQSS